MILSLGYRTLSKLVKSTLVSLFDKATLSSMIPLLKNKLKLKQRQEVEDEICTHEGLNHEGISSEEEGTRGSASSSFTQFSGRISSHPAPNHPSTCQNEEWCGGWDLNPRRPTPQGPKPCSLDQAWKPPQSCLRAEY